MASPTMKQSVSETTSITTHILRSKASSSSSSQIARSSRIHKHGKKDSSGGTDSLSSSSSLMNLVQSSSYHHHQDNILHNNEESSNTNSPYYKGLTDQSLAIMDDIHYGSCNALSSYSATYGDCSSPYYKGLTDYSLVIGSWNSAHVPPNSTSLSYACSPYYRGLIDYSLALHEPPSTSLLPPPPKNIIKPDPTLKDLIVHDVAFSPFQFRDDKTENPPGENQVESDVERTAVSEENNNADQQTYLEDMALVIEEPSNDVQLVSAEEKPLRERVSEISSEVESVIEKTVLEEEKPLRERVSEPAGNNHVENYIAEEEDKENADQKKTVMDVVVGKEDEEIKDLTGTEENSKEGNEYVWATKHQPLTLEDFICNRDKALQLEALVKEGCGCSHFIFEGPPSAGKRSMIRAMLREVFGAHGVQVVEECKNFNLKGEMVDNIQVRIKKSLHHVEVNLSETKGYEKHVIVDLFKETYGKMINNALPCSPENCQAIVLYEAEKLSLESLLYIKWLLEKYKGCNKVFFCCSDQSKLQPVKPLCTIVRLSPPSTNQIVKILEHIGRGEGIQLSPELAKKITLRSKNNLRQAIRSLEATCRNKDALKDDDLILTGWEDDISNIAKNIIAEQSPRQLYGIRRKLQSLMIHDVPPDFIYKSLVSEITNLVDDDSLRSGIAKLDKDYNKGSDIKFETKQLGHATLNKQAEWEERNNELTKKNAFSYLKVEEFIAKFMSWYKNSSDKSNKHLQLVAGT